MSTPESLLGDVLQTVCPGRVHLNMAPAGVARPYLIVQYLPGADARVFLNKTRGALVQIMAQISVWADDGETAITTARQVEAALLAATTISARPLGSLHTDVDDDNQRHSATQDYRVFAAR